MDKDLTKGERGERKEKKRMVCEDRTFFHLIIYNIFNGA